MVYGWGSGFSTCSVLTSVTDKVVAAASESGSDTISADESPNRKGDGRGGTESGLGGRI